MIPKIRFSTRKEIDGQVCFVAGGNYVPEKNIITINPNLNWRNKIGLLVHEFIHWFQWHFTYKKDMEKWNNEEEKQEELADKIQDFIHHSLLRG